MPPVIPAGVLAGRADEMTLLDGLLRDLARGSGGAVLIEGEPGIGKTALVRAVVEAGSAGRPGPAAPPGGWQVFWGTGDELGQELRLLPFLDALQVRRAPANARRAAIAALLRGEAAAGLGADVPAMLAEQLIALTIDEAAARPVALVIDDLQWADPATVALWGRLARAAAHAPLLLIGMSRPVPHREDLIALRRALGGGPRIQLPALPPAAVASLVGALAGGLPDAALLRLAAGAAGNPLYITELLAALGRSGGITVTEGGARLTAAAVPGSLPGAIADRLGFLSGPARQALRAAALLGVEFPLPDLVAVLGQTTAGVAPVLEEARAAGVLADDGGALAFRHPLIRDALYGEVRPALRAAWHRDAGRALAAAGAPPDRVARQLLHAVGPSAGTVATSPDDDAPAEPLDGWLLDWLAGTADSLIGQAPRVAAGLLARAVSGMPAGSARRSWLASRLADALYRAGDRAAAMRVAERGLSSAADPGVAVDLRWVIAQCQLNEGRTEASLAALEQALASPGVTDRDRGRLLVLAGRTCLADGQVAAGIRQASQALATAQRAGDTWAAGWALHVLAAGASMQGRTADALPLFEQALAVTETDPRHGDLALLLMVNKAGVLHEVGLYDEALSTGERACLRADQVGAALRGAQARSILSQIQFVTGRWDEVLAGVAVTPASAKEPGSACVDLALSAVIAFHRGRPEQGRRALAGAEAAGRGAGQRHVGGLLLARAVEREDAGAPGAALAVLTAVFDGGPLEDPGECVDWVLGDAVRLAVASGDKVTAQRLAGQAAALAVGPAARQAHAMYCQGLAGQDAALLAAAAQGYASAGVPLPQAQALEAAALILAGSSGGPARARPVLEQAVAAYQFLGAEADLRRVYAEFRVHGIRRGPHGKHRQAVEGWDSLTDTELKVAAFVEEGLSNPEIAARMMLSRKTIASHVSSILRKLRATSRSQIAREAALQGAGLNSARR